MPSKPRTLGPWAILAIVVGSYYVFYSFFGVTPKYWMKRADPTMPGMAFSYTSTLGGSLFAMMVVFALGWHRRLRERSARPRILGGWVAAESAYTLPSGICTGVVIFTTVYMYTLGPVVVAMIIMRGSLLVIGRIVDKILQWRGVRSQVVYWQSTAAVGMGLLAVAAIVVMAWSPDTRGIFDHPHTIPTILLYVAAYACRQLIMQWYKERNKGRNYDPVAFFGAEQYWAFFAMLLGGGVCIVAAMAGSSSQPIQQFYAAFRNTDGLAVLTCLPYGGIAFVSVFIFMFQAGSATFNVAINRFTSLMAGFTATVIAHLWLDQRWLYDYETYAFGILIGGFGFLFWAAFRRRAEDRATAAASVGAG